MQSSDGLKIKGTIIIRSHPAGTLHCYETLKGLGRLDLARELLADGKIEVERNNLIVDSSNYGIDILVQYLISAYIGSLNFPLGIAWGEIGTGSTTPANTDTALTTPTNRAPISYAFDNGFNTASVQFFFPDSALANGTYTECGSFIGGDSSIGSGNMFNHALFSSGYSKSAGVDTTLEIDVSISN
ncbi:MAG TPA: hypothetical protein VGL53_21555 [Bryobacteraceae bacterium]|jgi:hypothetical protein